MKCVAEVDLPSWESCGKGTRNCVPSGFNALGDRSEMGCGHVTGCRPWDVMGFGGNSWDASQGPGCFNQNRRLYRNGS